MKNKKDLILVLWGNNFDSLATATFVTQLRTVGLRVKLVALSHRNITGTQGLTLLPDMTLEQIIEKPKQIRCVIIPPHDSNELVNDPRINPFLKKTNALLIIPKNTDILQATQGDKPDPKSITYIPDDETYFNFTHQLAIYLSTS